MADTITRNSVPAAPVAGIVFVSGYDAGRRVEHLLHPQLHGAGHVVVWRPVRKRAGTLELFFRTAAEAHTAAALLTGAYTYTLAADEASLGMTFVLRPGDLKPRQARTGSAPYQLDVPFQEI